MESSVTLTPDSKIQLGDKMSVFRENNRDILLEILLKDVSLGAFCLDVPSARLWMDDRANYHLDPKSTSNIRPWRTWVQRIHPDDRNATIRSMARVIAGHTPVWDNTYRILGQDAEWLWLRGLAKPTDFDQDNRARRIIGIFIDQTESKAIETQLEHFDPRDPLTGLMRVTPFMERMEEEVIRSRRYKLPLCLAAFEVENLQNLREKYGTAAANQTLVTLARLVNEESRDTDFKVRLADGAVALLMPQTPGKGGIICAERIRKRMGKVMFRRGSEEFTAEASGGIAEFQPDLLGAVMMVNVAESGLDQARISGGGIFWTQTPLENSPYSAL